ncbi:MAG: NotI family restriction endonuclease [Prochlorothrix sp.]
MIITNPLAEVFGFPADSNSPLALHHRQHKLCPYHNRVPHCTKDKAQDPLGVCSIYHRNQAVITCPVRFRQDWSIATDAAQYFFGTHPAWTVLTEVRMQDAEGRSAGNVDMVLVAYDRAGHILDFGSVEVQAVYISGNVRQPFEQYMQDPDAWNQGARERPMPHPPKPDYLSSSRKRLLPQLLAKGSILRAWGKKQVIAVQKQFFETLPPLPQVSAQESEIAWHLYELEQHQEPFQLKLTDVVYTQYWAAINQISTPSPGPLSVFLGTLQRKLDTQQE